MRSSRLALLLVPDLFFVEKIRTAAAHLGIGVDASFPTRLHDDCRIRRPDLVLVDLREASGTLEAVRVMQRRQPVRVRDALTSRRPALSQTRCALSDSRAGSWFSSPTPPP